MSIYLDRIVLNKGLPGQYLFPRTFSIDPPPWSKRLNELERAYKHGSVITGDEMVKARPVRVWGTLAYSNALVFQNELDLMEATCYMKRLTLHADRWWPNRYLCVDLSNFARIDYPTLQAGEIDILFRITDPFWYSTTMSSNSQNGVTSGNLTPFSNNGQIEVSPDIHVRIPVGSSITAITVGNLSDGNRNFTYTRALGVGKGFRVRGSVGTVHYWSGAGYADDIASFTGTFYRLQPGSNQIVLAITPPGATVNITHYWREKWLG